MRNLYIDFDGVIMDTVDISYQELIDLGLDHKNPDHQQQIREFYVNLNWDILLNRKSKIINNAFEGIQKIIDSGRFNVSILTHSNSLHEQVEKVKFIRQHLDHITIIPVPKEISKTKMVNPENAILIDDYSGNLREWEAAGGIGIKFSLKLSSTGFIVIDNLTQILDRLEITEAK